VLFFSVPEMERRVIGTVKNFPLLRLASQTVVLGGRFYGVYSRGFSVVLRGSE
jgi:hypothetical protein